jgi:hypothetical protein
MSAVPNSTDQFTLRPPPLRLSGEATGGVLGDRGERGLVHEGPVGESVGVALVVVSDDRVAHVHHLGLVRGRVGVCGR